MGSQVDACGEIKVPTDPASLCSSLNSRSRNKVQKCLVTKLSHSPYGHQPLPHSSCRYQVFVGGFLLHPHPPVSLIDITSL